MMVVERNTRNPIRYIGLDQYRALPLKPQSLPSFSCRLAIEKKNKMKINR